MRRGTLGLIALAAALALPAFAAGQEEYEFDTTPPEVAVGGKTAQEPRGKRVARIRGSCNEPCRIAATGDVVIKPSAAVKRTELRLKRRFARLKSGERWAPVMELAGEKARKSLKDALASGADVHADIRLRAEDTVGNPAKAYIRINLKR
jgi:hypothetical protein